MMKKNLLALGTALAAVAVALPAHAAVSLTDAAAVYSQSFDSLTTAVTPVSPWTNDSTLAGWSLFNSTGAAITTYLGGTGGSNTGSFYSFGAAANTERALGGAGSGNAYFGSPVSGAVAGWIAAAFDNNTGATLSAATISFDGEQWRNGGNTSAQIMRMEYGFGASFGAVTWMAADAGFNWTSPVTGSTAAAVDGNSAGLVPGLGGTLATTWAPGQTLWLRWAENNDVGNDHGLAIDNFSLSVTAVPEPESYALLLAGLAALGLLARRRQA
ncbi:MAG: PEP-CTERM sorting domain-containing protein [Pseudomonadota bacterium]